MSRIVHNLALIRERIHQAAQECGRNPDEIQLLGVTKKCAAQDIRIAYEAGVRHFGESYLQEALPKISSLSDLDITWHFIGPIQSNKTRQIAEHFSWVHSVDRLKIATRLSEQRPVELGPLNICIQVNISLEDSKSGIIAEAAKEFALQLSKLPGIRLRGLMAIVEKTSDQQSQRGMFSQLRDILDDLNQHGLSLDTLSMGMTDDLEAAVMEGSTLLRIGTGLFGQRQP
ncbi:YggS family pyridoxal phosphate-dependent enzyme [Kaarinaea lacus]